MTNAMGGAHLHTPQSIFQHMMGQPNTSQQPAPWFQMRQIPSVPRSKFFTTSVKLPQKRKREVFDVIEMCTKQFITEEKMAAHFKDLHISSNYQSPTPVPSTSTAEVESNPCKELNMELDVDGTNVVDADQTNSERPKLVFSEELKRLQQEPILPSSLLSKLERPTMALVLWQPPNKHLRILPTRDTPMPIPASDDNNNNNSDSIPNLNQTSSSNSVFEPMEL